jgi:hypothetical protein
MATRSSRELIFAHSSAAVVSSNPIHGMDVCV